MLRKWHNGAPMPPSRKSASGRRKTSGRASRRKAPRSRLRVVFKWLFVLAFWGGLVGGLWAVWVGYQVRQQFESLQWALPGRIYARPLELYAGAHLGRDDLVFYLERAGFRQVNGAPGAGQYRVSGNGVELHTRGFRFWDGEEEPRFVAVEFSGNTVTAVHGASQRPLALARLDPVEIAQINPETGEDRIPLRRDEIPDALIDALVAVEDQRFHEHFGIDPRGIARAALANVLEGGISQGGSTLTQQLVKNLYLSQERTLRRKIEEAVMAVALELQFDKDQILTAYVNEVYLGQDGNRAIHGFALASEYYFGRPLKELRLPELAMLAGLPRGASWYNPLRHPERAAERRNTVLARMRDEGYIDANSYAIASAAPLGVSRSAQASVRNGYPSFLELVYQDLARDYDRAALRTEGLKIFTTLDVRVQHVLESTLEASVQRVTRGTKGPEAPLEAAVVLTDASTGEVRGLAGSRKAGYTGFNRALNARRPIGSLVKPAVYLAALERDAFNLATVLADVPISMKLENGTVWEPQNYDRFTEGDVYLFDALQRSLNLATVDLGMKLGLDKVVAMLGRLGYNKPVAPFPSLLLGAVDMAPIEVAGIYQTLASNGFRTGLRSVEAVTSATGEPLEYYGIRSTQAVDPQSLYLLEQALFGVFENGTGKSVRQRLEGHLPLVGKTGTTNDLRDSWFAGYGDDLVGVVWLGYDDNRSSGLTGATGALQVWTDLMTRLDIQPRQDLPPAGIQWEKVPRYAERNAAWRDCSATLALPFRAGALPDAGWFCEASDSFFERVMERFK